MDLRPLSRSLGAKWSVEEASRFWGCGGESEGGSEGTKLLVSIIWGRGLRNANGAFPNADRRKNLGEEGEERPLRLYSLLMAIQNLCR